MTSLTYTVSEKFLSDLGSFHLDWNLGGLLKIFRVKGFKHNVLISLASRVTKLLGKSPLQTFEHARLKNSAKNSPKFYPKIIYSGNVTFSVYITNKI